MNLRKHTFRFHRWLGLVIGLQLLAWSAGGLFFTLFEISTIRGTADAVDREPTPLLFPEHGISAKQALAVAATTALNVEEITSVVALQRREQLVWDLRTKTGQSLALVDIRTGTLLRLVPQEEAEAIALADFAHPAHVRQSLLIESDPPGEFRGRRLPAWQVTLNHPKQVRIYIDALTGQVVARRNRLWRIFDFFWMLHIMDYDTRSDFHHPLLTIASALAVLTSLTGLMLWGWRFKGRRRGR